MLFRSGTPPDIQARINEEIRKACLSDECRAVWAAQGAEFGTMPSAQFASFVSAEVKRWEGVVKVSGAKLD